MASNRYATTGMFMQMESKRGCKRRQAGVTEKTEPCEKRESLPDSWKMAAELPDSGKKMRPNGPA